MEAHLVHCNKKYGSFNRAINHKDGIVVVAFFIETDENVKNEEFATITDQIQNIRKIYSKSYVESGGEPKSFISFFA